MRKEIQCKFLENTLPIYSKDDVAAAMEMASNTIKGIAKLLKEADNRIGADATENAVFSYEQILRASLRLDDSKGRGGRSPITNKGGQNG